MVNLTANAMDELMNIDFARLASAAKISTCLLQHFINLLF